MKMKDILDYVRHTPENVNPAILKQMVNLYRESGEDEDEGEDESWTTIRLDAQYVEQNEGYMLISSNEEDINNFKQLIQLYQNNQHPIVRASYKSCDGSDNDMGICAFSTGPAIVVDFYNFIVDSMDVEESFFENEVLAALFLSSEDGFMEIKYKTGNYYTISASRDGDIINSYIKQGDSWTVPDFFSKHNYRVYDETNEYDSGDIITPTSDMVLEIQQQTT